MPIMDRKGCVIGAVIAPPSDPTWNPTMKHCADKLERLRPDLYIPKDHKNHCRGKFPAIPFGISLGQGQEEPRILQNESNATAIEEIVNDHGFIRIAGFQSSLSAYNSLL